MRAKLDAESLKLLIKEVAPWGQGFDLLSDQVFVTDDHANVLYANEATIENTGFSMEEIIGRNPGDLWGGKMPKEFYEKMWRIIKIEGKPFVAEVKNTTKSGEEYWQELRISPVFDHTGAIKFFIGIEPNIKLRKQIEQAKDEFISIASHQLRTPVSAMSWLAEALKYDSQDLGPKQKKYVEDLSVMAQKLAELVEDLLNISRIQLESYITAEKTKIDISDLISEFIKEIDEYARLKKCALIVHNTITGACVVELNKRTIKNVLQNIVSNAIDYSVAQSPVDITIEKNDRSIKISIASKSFFIPEEEQAHIFERFYRSDAARKIKTRGTGLGLYVAKMIIKESGGDIGFTSNEDGNTVFWFTIPLKPLKVADINEAEGPSH